MTGFRDDPQSPDLRTAPVPIHPDEYVQHRTTDGETTNAHAQRAQQLYGEMLLHREHDLYVAAPGKGRTLQDLIREQLRAERFSADDADEWAFRDWHKWLTPQGQRYNELEDPWLADQVRQAALAYRDTGMPIDEAFQWTISSINAHYATYLRQQGWNPHAYRESFRLLFQESTTRQYPSGTESPDVDREHDGWTAAPIAAWRCLRYLQAGLTLDEAMSQEEARRAGHNTDSTIDTLIALRRASPDHQDRY